MPTSTMDSSIDGSFTHFQHNCLSVSYHFSIKIIKEMLKTKMITIIVQKNQTVDFFGVCLQ